MIKEVWFSCGNWHVSGIEKSEILTDAFDFDKGSALKDWAKVCGSI